MSIPKILSKITTHNPPRYMLYQPGFNASNSCWLNGDWVTLPKDEWERRKNEHEKMYGIIRDQEKNQHHRDKGTAVKNMTPAQRQAWEHYSGSITLDCMFDGTNTMQCVGANTAGKKLSEKTIKWMRAKKYRIIKNVTRYKKATNQLRGLEDVPKDLVIDTDKSVDTVAMTIKQNNERFDSFADACLDSGSPFGVAMGIERLIDLEEEIIREEWEKSIGEKDPYEDIKGTKEKYQKAIKNAISKLGSKVFKIEYNKSKKSHNECARTNLDNSKGHLFRYVLPKFNQDGSHEPWGEKDVPWGNKKSSVF